MATYGLGVDRVTGHLNRRREEEEEEDGEEEEQGSHNENESEVSPGSRRRSEVR